MALEETVAAFVQSELPRCDVDFAGAPVDWGYTGQASVAVYVTDPVDALKQSSAGQIVGSIDRDTVWALQGLSVARRAVAQVPVDLDDVDRWVGRLRAAGLDTEIIERSDAP